MDSKRQSEVALANINKKQRIEVKAPCFPDEIWWEILQWIANECTNQVATIPQVCKFFNELYKNFESQRLESFLQTDKGKKQAMMFCMSHLCSREIVSGFWIHQDFKQPPEEESPDMLWDGTTNVYFWGLGDITCSGGYWKGDSQVKEIAEEEFNWGGDERHVAHIVQAPNILGEYLDHEEDGFWLLLTDKLPSGDEDESEDEEPVDLPKERREILQTLPEDDIFWSMVGTPKRDTIVKFEKNVEGHQIKFAWFDMALQNKDMRAKISCILKICNKVAKVF